MASNSSACILLAVFLIFVGFPKSVQCQSGAGSVFSSAPATSNSTTNSTNSNSTSSSPGQQCDQSGYLQCVVDYTISLGLSTLDGVSQTCSASNDLKTTLLSCVNSVGCSVLNRLVDQLHTMIYGLFDGIFCNPSTECTLLNTLKCYEDVFKSINVQIPTDMSKTASFIDSLPRAMYGNKQQYCRSVQNISYEVQAQCVNTEMDKLFKDCLPKLLPEGAIQDKKQYETIFRSSLGQFGDSKLMKTSTESLCGSSCKNYLARYDKIKSCTKVYLRAITEIVRIGGKEYCKETEAFGDCVSDSIQGCQALENTLISNAQLKGSLESCRVNIHKEEVAKENNYVHASQTQTSSQGGLTANYLLLIPIATYILKSNIYK